jgi:aldehyde:ferredoxin oxidoreductase
MGAKNLKAVLARGGAFRILPRERQNFARVKKRAMAYINQNPLTSQSYRQFGTSSHVRWCNEAGILPVHNFRHGSHPDAGAISGEAMAKRYKPRPHTCRPCAIRCGHRTTQPDGAKHPLPEYESVGLLGPNLGIFDPDAICRWNELCGRLGMDTISAGAILGWVMEAGERDLVETGLRFGSTDGIDAALQDMAHRRGFGDRMAEGTRRLSQAFGGSEFAIQVKGLELAAYDPRGSWGQGLAYAVANRGGCHLSATTFALEVGLDLLNPYTVRAKAHFVHFFENLYAAVNSLHTCQFTTYAYVLEPPLIRLTPRFLLGLSMQYLPWLAVRLMDLRVFSELYSSVTGIPLSQRRLLLAGDRIHTLERWMNTREGITRADDTLPERMLKEARSCDPHGRGVPLDGMLDTYYRLRGYGADGVPTPQTLRRLHILR